MSAKRGSKTSEPGSEPVTIEIAVTEDGDFVYSNSTHRMTRKPEGEAKFTRVKWKAEGPFVIDFGEASPFNRLTLKNEGGDYESEEVAIESAAQLRRYKYAVAVFFRDEVFMDNCPEVVVEC